MRKTNILKIVDIKISELKLEVVLYKDGNFQVNHEGEELSNFKDSNHMFIYYIEESDGESCYFFKHEIARDYLLDGLGDYIIYADNDYNNLNISNLKKCEYREYVETMRNRAIEYEENKKNMNKSRTNQVNKAISIERDRFYQVKLPNGEKVKLKKNISIDEKIKIVEDLVSDWDDFIRLNWHSKSVKFFLNSLSNYLVWHVDYTEPIPRNGEILSNRKNNRLLGLEKDNNLTYFESNPEERERYY